MILRALSAFWTTYASQMANHLWQSTLFVALAAILAFVLRKNQGRVRYWVWLTASLKFLIPFSLLIALGSHLATPRVSTPAQAVVYSAIEDFSQPFAGQEMPVISKTAPSPAPVSRFHLLPPILVAVWFAGIIVVLLVWAAGWILVSLMVRRSVPLGQGPEIEALRRLESSLGARRPTELVVSRNWMEPGIFGVFSPVLIWPEGISQHLDDRHIDAILAHEVCHARRHDNLTAILHMLVEAVFWFYPLVWWLGARLEEERERACDEEVSLLCSQPHVYAESILRVCKFCSESPLACVSGITGADLKQRIVQIMTERAVRKLDLGRKLLLWAVAAVAVAAPLALGLAHRPLVFAQILHASGPLPSFEVATIKPDKPRQSLWVQPPENIWRMWGVSVRGLVGEAYDVPFHDTKLRVLGGSDWIDSNRYDIEAEIPAALVAEREKMDSGLRANQTMLMVQSLLADRFKLRVHFETRELPIYELVTAKGGPKLTPAKEPPPEPDSPPPNAGRPNLPPPLRQGMRITSNGRGVNEMTVKGETLDEWAESSPFDGPDARPIVNKTGLTGRYDFTLNWAVDAFAGPPANGQGAAVPPTDAPSLITALQEQLGLELVKAKGPVEVIVIDHIEKPDLDDAQTYTPRPAPTEPAPPTSARNIVTTWQGTLGAGRGQRLVVKMTRAGDGTLRAAFYNIDTAPDAIPAISVTLNGSALKLELPFATYQGTVSTDGNSIAGTWRQGQNPVPLNFARATPVTEWTIPQATHLVPMAAGANPAFEAATIKPSRPEEHGPRYDFRGRRFSVIHVSLSQLVQYSYELQQSQIAKAQDWVNSESYDIAAVPDGGGEPSGKQWQAMVKKLMADRFQLKFHLEKQEQTVYLLTVARTGAKLTRSESATSALGGNGFGPPGSFGATNETMADIAKALGAGVLNRPVVDQTGLSGRFNLRLTWTPDGPATAKENPNSPPDFFTAIQEQLGLKVISTKAPVDVLVIDHVERPSEN